MHADQHVVSAALQAGAAGYVLKECAGSELVDAIRTVADNRTYLSPAVAGGVVRDYVAHLTAAEMHDQPRLTSRERQILQLIAEGHATKDIAARLDISAKTVGTHREHIMAKLDVHSVAGLTKYAIRQGITTSESGPSDLSGRR
jgi:DNA-binding NarL/FixJ family response regulator